MKVQFLLCAFKLETCFKCLKILMKQKLLSAKEAIFFFINETHAQSNVIHLQ